MNPIIILLITICTAAQLSKRKISTLNYREVEVPREFIQNWFKINVLSNFPPLIYSVRICLAVLHLPHHWLTVIMILLTIWVNKMSIMIPDKVKLTPENTCFSLCAAKVLFSTSLCSAFYLLCVYVSLLAPAVSCRFIVAMYGVWTQ